MVIPSYKCHLPVYINPVPTEADQITIEKEVNFPTLQRAIEKNANAISTGNNTDTEITNPFY